MSTLRSTPLNAEHRALGAKLVDFGGWEMPLHYGSQIEEHHAVRRDAGMFDVSHMQAIDLDGASVRPFLLHLLANNIERLALPGKALYSCMLNPEGGVIDDLIAYRLEDASYRLVVNAATADKDLRWIIGQRDAAAAGVRITPRQDLAIVAIQGPHARQKVWQAVPGLQPQSEGLAVFSATVSGNWLVARTGYTGEDGFEVLLPGQEVVAFWRALRQAGVMPAGLGARDTLRLEAGMNLYGQDMDEATTPLESGLAWTVDLKSPRDFVGKSALLRRPPRTRLTGLVCLERGVLRHGQKVLTPHGEGAVTSGSFSPTLNVSIALARVPTAVEEGVLVQVEGRDRLLRARTVKYPFVRNGKSLVASNVS